MTVLPIVKAPDPRLKLVSKPVEKIDSDLNRFIADMVETMYDANGVGLAAIQVGVPLRLAVIDLDPKGPNSKVLTVINPVILETSDDASTYNEGCLSVPDFWEDVQRAARVKVEYRDEHWKTQTADADGLFAVCLQHEIDHINGKLFVDHLSKLKRDMALRKSAKLKRQAGG